MIEKWHLIQSLRQRFFVVFFFNRTDSIDTAPIATPLSFRNSTDHTFSRRQCEFIEIKLVFFFWLSLSSISSCCWMRRGAEEEGQEGEWGGGWGQRNVGWGRDTYRGGLWATETPAGIIVSCRGVTMGLTVFATPPKNPHRIIHMSALTPQSDVQLILSTGTVNNTGTANRQMVKSDH